VGALAVLGVLLWFNRVLRITALTPYLLGGAVMWFLIAPLCTGQHRRCL
jgi:NhaA family Na+:H+ antiporter